MPKGSSVCPHCGKDNAEAVSTEKAKSNRLSIALCVVGLVSLLAALTLVILMGVNGGWGKLFGGKGPDPTGDPSQSTTTAPTEYVPGEGVLSRQSYTAEDQMVLDAARNVVARFGDRELTNEELQHFYWMEFYNLLDYYGFYIAYYGLDIQKPMDTQPMMDSGMSWQQYLLETSLNTWKYYGALADLAQQEGFTLSEEMQQELDGVAETLEKQAQEGGYESVEAMIRKEMGPGATLDGYRRYLEACYLGESYVGHLKEMNEPDQAAIEEYYTAHEEDIVGEGYGKDAGLLSDVRHILIMPEGGTEDDKGNKTYSEEEWEACRVKAQGILDDWLAGEATEETFIEFTGSYTEDPGYDENGGFYGGIVKGANYVEEFLNWAIDESRKAGDYGLVRTTYGYHIMYMVECDQAWIRYTRELLLTEKCTGIIKEAMEANELEVTYENIQLGFVDFSKQEETE